MGGSGQWIHWDIGRWVGGTFSDTGDDRLWMAGAESNKVCKLQSSHLNNLTLPITLTLTLTLTQKPNPNT